VPFNFYNLKNISRAGLANGSLIKQMAFLLLKLMLFFDISTFHNLDLLFHQPVKLVDQRIDLMVSGLYLALLPRRFFREAC